MTATFSPARVLRLLAAAEALADLEKSAVLYMGEATFRVTRAKLDRAKAALAALEEA